MKAKENWGRCGMASDERSDYRAGQGRVTGRRDFIAERAEFMQWRNHPEWAARDGYLPTLGIASKWRSVAVARRLSGRPLLG